MNSVVKSAVDPVEVINQSTFENQHSSIKQLLRNSTLHRNTSANQISSLNGALNSVKAAMTPVVTAIDPMVSDCPAAR